MPAFGPNQLPVRIARRHVASKGPDIRDVRDLVRAAINHRATSVVGHRNDLRDKPNGHVGHAITYFGADELGPVDANELALDFFAALFALADRLLEALVDLPRQ